MENTVKMPMLPLRGIVAFPYTLLNLEVARKPSIDAVELAMKRNERLVFLAAQRDMRVEEPCAADIYKMGVVARVRHVLKTERGGMRVLVEGLSRARMLACETEGCFNATIAYADEVRIQDADKAEAYMRILLDNYEEFGEVSGKVPQEAVLALRDIHQPEKLADTISQNILQGVDKKQEMLEILDVEQRIKRLIDHISEEINIAKFTVQINQATRHSIEKIQKDAFLREQMKTIQNALGEGDEEGEAKVFEQKVKALDINEQTREKLLREVNRFARLSPTMPDHSVLRNYLETVTSLPFGKYSEDDLNLTHARKVLDDEHFGMDKVKDRIIESLAVKQLAQDQNEGSVICLVGPPGVGKTSIAHSIAHALGRQFVRMSLGGVHDEAEIRGHRRTYIGAIPGRIITNIKKAGTMNPVFLLDEIDKMGSDFKGDPASAMLEVLDPAINKTFADNYLDIEFDLSSVMFITTANDASTIPSALYDRMEIIELSGYTSFEKLNIAKKHIIPKQLKKHGLNGNILRFETAAIESIITGYTAESGVRTLERRIATICRKAAAQYLEGKKRITVTKKNLESFLGTAMHNESNLPKQPTVGVACGLAWTSIGGCTMPIEVTHMPGAGALELTGSLGDVMKESAKTALSFIRSRAGEMGIDDAFFKENDVHVHVPEGAVPKDGPSAGITLCTAMVSSFTNRPVRCDVAMTGEITLTGRVLPIGGLKEKALAALRDGVHNIIIPAENAADIKEIPDELQEQLTFTTVKNIEEVLKRTLD